MYTVSFSIECVYWTLRVVLFLVNCLWEFACELSNTLFSLCPSRYVFCVWETSDLFPGALDHCLPHHYIHQWFNCSPWLDLSKLVLIHFSFDLFFSSHGSSFVLLTLLFVHIDLHSVFDIFHTSFLYIPLAVQYSSFLPFHHWYIHLGFFLPDRYIHIERFQIHGLWDSLHILHFIHKDMRFWSLGIWA